MPKFNIEVDIKSIFSELEQQGADIEREAALALSRGAPTGAESIGDLNIASSDLGLANTTFFSKDLNELSDKIGALENLTGHKSRDILENFGATVNRKMNAYVPIDTGQLQRSLRYEVGADSIEFEARALDPDTGEDYAPIQEYGGYNAQGQYINPQPYFRRAIIEEIGTLDDALLQRARKLMIKG